MGQDKIIRDIEKRIAEFTLIPPGHGFFTVVNLLVIKLISSILDRCVYIKNLIYLQSTEHGEGIQVVHYEVGQRYAAHRDYFRDELNLEDGGQRMATLLMYL